MFLSIDAGNSNIVFGFYEAQSSTWRYVCRVNTKIEFSLMRLEQELHLYFLENGIKIEHIDQVGLSSVVPEINQMIVQFCSDFLGKSCYLISGKSYKNLKVSTKRPNEIGTDIMCNVAATYQKFQDASIIVDFGTALTFTVLAKNGAVSGVNIVPGLNTAMRSLFHNTSKLPEVELVKPKSAIGKDTVESIQAGLYYGYSGLVKGMLAEIEDELGYSSKIIATGGLSSIISNLQSRFDMVDRNLTLEGIRLITNANQLI